MPTFRFLRVRLPGRRPQRVPCQNSKAEKGLVIEAWSGDATKKTECAIAGRSGIRHMIRIESAMTYDADIECVGIIRHQPSPVRFVSTKPGDTDDRWTGVDVLQGINSSMNGNPCICLFDHAEIQTISPGRETPLSVQVIARWHADVMPDSIVNVDINVTA